MLPSSTYVGRRERLAADLQSGLAVFLGNGEAPMNYRDNQYAFRQDSSFLYFFGLDRPDLAAVVDADTRASVVFGDEFTMADIVWRGPQPTIASMAADAGLRDVRPRAELTAFVAKAVREKRPVHFLPQYRAENTLWLGELTGIPSAEVSTRTSSPLIKAVVSQRAVKSSDEIAELHQAVATTHDMHVLGMRQARAGRLEREVAAAMEALVRSRGVELSFPVIFTMHGETLHNHPRAVPLEAGRMAVNDAGAESPLRYAGDITRTIPIGGRFSSAQRDLYEAVLRAQTRAIEAIRPGVPYRDVHLLAARSITDDLVALKCMRGDPQAAVAAGAHALFFPHGLGHMIGLDVHDMEALGEDHVGYDDQVRRSTQFGLKSLRLGRALQPGFVLTVEPGIYFIPALIDQWRSERRLEEFIDYDAVNRYRDAGGIRIEDNVLVTEVGCTVLGPPIPKRASDVEAIASE